MSAFERRVPVYHRSPEGELVGTIVLTLSFQQEEDQWVGTCVELGTSTHAFSLQEADEEVAEAIALQLNEVERLGFIAEYLAEHNVHEAPAPVGGGQAAWVLAASR